MAIKPLGLTEHGEKQLRVAHKSACAKLKAVKERHAKELQEALDAVSDMTKCIDCEHEYDDAAINGAMLGVMDVTCVKCGFTWYD